METKKKIAAGAGLALFALALAAKDPVIMTVNGVDVPKSEFEYLYGKNSQQQLTQQPLDEYVEMFKLYKLKVEDAKAEGIDTTAAFRKEMEQYRNDLAAPYLADSTYLNHLLEETYSRMKEEVETRHIMFFKKPGTEYNAAARERLDSIRKAIIAGADFSEMAKRYSEDRGSAPRGGKMGFITARQYPYDFETAAYTTPEGEVSEIVESPAGYHILFGGKHRPARGKIQAAHILKLAQGNDPVKDAAARVAIDSLYKVVMKDPSLFSDVAMANSDDKGSARQGGMLPWFGSGEMVEEFDSVAFSLSENVISEPFRTAFGWHIVKRTGTRPIPSMEQVKPEFFARISSPQDERYARVRANQTARLAKLHKSKTNEKTMRALRGHVTSAGIDSLFYTVYADGPDGKSELFSINGVVTPVSEFAKSLGKVRQKDTGAALEILQNAFDSFYNHRLVDAEIDRLGREETDYRNLLNEYHDGSLLYEVSVRKIWDKAAKDVEGLENYFNTHRENYKWSVPHAKGYLVQAADYSIASKVKELVAVIGRDTIVNTVRKSFPGKVYIEKVLVEKGANPMVDNLLFNGAPTAPSKKNMAVFFMVDPRVIDTPEEFADVRGLVTSDYQNEFQSRWEEELKKKYPVKIYPKVLKSVKKKAN